MDLLQKNRSASIDLFVFLLHILTLTTFIKKIIDYKEVKETDKKGQLNKLDSSVFCSK